MKLLFEYLISSFYLFEDPIKNYVAMAIVGCIAYIIAYGEVGLLYHLGLIDGRESGHMLHYIIRFVVFVFIFFICTIVIRAYNWFHDLPVYKWWVIVSIAGIYIIAQLVKKCILYKKKKIE